LILFKNILLIKLSASVANNSRIRIFVSRKTIKI